MRDHCHQCVPVGAARQEPTSVSLWGLRGRSSVGRLTGPQVLVGGLSVSPVQALLWSRTVPSIIPQWLWLCPHKFWERPQAKPLALLCPRAVPSQRGFPYGKFQVPNPPCAPVAPVMSSALNRSSAPSDLPCWGLVVPAQSPPVPCVPRSPSAAPPTPPAAAGPWL